MELINWAVANWATIVEAYLALVGFASVVVKLTPTVNDDLWLKKILQFTGRFVSLNKTLKKK